MSHSEVISSVFCSNLKIADVSAGKTKEGKFKTKFEIKNKNKKA